MQSKYGKLLLNLRNIVEAALGLGADLGRFAALLRAEAEAAYQRLVSNGGTSEQLTRAENA